MNMTIQLCTQDLSQNDRDLLQHAFDALHRTTGLEGRLAEVRVPTKNGGSAEALVEIAAEGKRHRYVAVLKRVDRFATLGIIKHQFERYDEPGLLVARHITPEVAERCRELHIPFIDTAGNVYLQKPGLLVFVKGQRARLEDLPREETTLQAVPATMRYVANIPIVTTTPRVGMATMLRVVFALLC